jgi:hypothetical protein
MGRIGNSPYSLHPGYAMEETSRANLLQRTGKTLEEWVGITQREGPASEFERQAWLKNVHGFTTNYAWWVAERSFGRGAPEQYDPAGMVDAMFAGPKAALRPIYDALLAIGLTIGPDVKACPCATIVPLYRNHVFAQIKPATAKRIDFGFALKDTPVSGRLVDTGGFAKKDRITHRIPIASLEEIDDEVESWLRKAYEMDG